MNLKTTLLLLLLAAAGGVFWLALVSLRPKAVPSETLDVLHNRLAPDQLSRIEIRRGDHHVVLERGAGGEWALPGNWPARRPEVEQLVNLIGGLRSRFAPFPLTGDADDLA